MPISAIIIVVCSGLFHALRDFLTKKADNKIIFMWWYMLLGVIIPLPLYIHYLQGDSLSLIAVQIAFISALIHVLYRIFLSKSLQHGDFSHVYPIARSAPAFVLIFSLIFLKESVSLLGALGIILISFGIYSINLKSLTIHNLLDPIKAIIKCKASKYAFLTLLSVTAYSIIDKKGVDLLHPISFFFLMELFTITMFTILLVLQGELKNPIKEIKKHKIAIPMSSLFMVLSYILVLIAYKLTNVSYVVGLRQISVVFAVLLGMYFFKEKHKFIRLFSASIIFIGAFLISIA